MSRSSEDKVIIIVSKRISTNEVQFWELKEKIHKKTFASLSKKAKVKSVEACNSKRGQELVWAAFDSFTIKRNQLKRSVKVRAGPCPLRTGSSLWIVKENY